MEKPKLNIVTLNSRGDRIFIHQRSAQRNECKIALISSDHFIGEFGTIVRGLDYFSVSFPGDARGESGLRELASVNRSTRLRNGHVADFGAELWQ